jgi:hypothetical protein
MDTPAIWAELLRGIRSRCSTTTHLGYTVPVPDVYDPTEPFAPGFLALLTTFELTVLQRDLLRRRHDQPVRERVTQELRQREAGRLSTP